jgi:hypothetical protein
MLHLEESLPVAESIHSQKSDSIVLRCTLSLRKQSRKNVISHSNETDPPNIPESLADTFLADPADFHCGGQARAKIGGICRKGIEKIAEIAVLQRQQLPQEVIRDEILKQQGVC